MKYVIQDLERLQIDIPVICGGAALTRKYVEDDLRKEYSSAVFYAEDAFAGLHVMSDITADEEAVRQDRLAEGRTVKVFPKTNTPVDGAAAGAVSTARSARSPMRRTFRSLRFSACESGKTTTWTKSSAM